MSAFLCLHDVAGPCRSKGYGFVSFKTQKAAEKAIATMNGKVIGHRYIPHPDFKLS